MSTDYPDGPPAFRRSVEIGLDRGLQRKRVPGTVEQCEIERQMQSWPFGAVKVADPVGLALNLAARGTDSGRSVSARPRQCRAIGDIRSATASPPGRLCHLQWNPETRSALSRRWWPISTMPLQLRSSRSSLSSSSESCPSPGPSDPSCRRELMILRRIFRSAAAGVTPLARNHPLNGRLEPDESSH